MNSRILVAVRVRGSPVRAFEVFVREIGAWWRPSALFAFTDGRPGRLGFLDGALVETKEEGEVFEIGRVTAWEPGSRLGFTWRQASFAPGQVTQVDVRFEAAGEETRVTVCHTGWDSVPADHRARHGFPDAVHLRRHGEWWQALLAAYAGDVAACGRGT